MITSAKDTKKTEEKKIRMKTSRTHKPDDLSLEEWQRLLRKQFGEQMAYRLENVGDHPLFSDYALTNPESGRKYKIAIRGDKPGDNYCSCPDFSINNLGTCKHIEYTLSHLMQKSGAKKAFQDGYVPPFSEIFLHYGLKREVRFKAGKDAPAELRSRVNEYFDSQGTLKDDRLLEFPQFFNTISTVNGHEVRCYDDVMDFIAGHQDAEHRRTIISERLKEGIDSPVISNILKTELYPYQREGALFAVKAGRCLIGDDMGLGKTIQALAASELMAELFHIRKVLIVSPTSLKYQWRTEIEKFSGRPVQVIEGVNHQRQELYRAESFYKVINYELVSRDVGLIQAWEPDLIILDEAQRIKNWKTRTAQTVKKMESTFAIVLTGTPIENRIEELHSIMEFVDRRHLGPLYRFVQDHRIDDAGGKVVGYKNLQSVRKSLGNVMIRRKKNEVLKQLPERIDKNFLVPMTPEQREIHDENYDTVARLVAKWRRHKFLCEADQRRLQIALNFMRMAADNTYLVDKKTVHGPKTEELDIVLKELIIEGGEKVVIFSQWRRMAELVEGVLNKNGIGYVCLHGGVPSKQRKDLMAKFKDDPACKVFLSTDAGGVGLNLQSGSVVINMDIPWNPAVLEQRIGRVHRLGQSKTVRVINFVTTASIEERILDLLKFKKSLSTGVLDSGGEDVVMMGDSQLKRFMQSVETMTDKLEKADQALESQERQEAAQDETAARLKEQAEAKGAASAATGAEAAGKGLEQLGSLLASGAQFLTNLSKIISQPSTSAEGSMGGLVARDEKTGKNYLKIPLPDKDVMQQAFSALGDFFAKAMQMGDTINKR